MVICDYIRDTKIIKGSQSLEAIIGFLIVLKIVLIIPYLLFFHEAYVFSRYKIKKGTKLKKNSV